MDEEKGATDGCLAAGRKLTGKVNEAETAYDDFGAKFYLSVIYTETIHSRTSHNMETSPLPSPHDMKAAIPLSAKTATFIEKSRDAARKIVAGKEERKALIIGPCSIHERTSALEYAKKFRELSDAVADTCFLVMRVYAEKSRTKVGWKGLLYDPHLDGSHDIKTGLLWTRELLLSLADLGVPCATEFVDPLAATYFDDLITWGFIGARTTSSQIHRQFSSHLNIPAGFKNSTDGNLDNAVHGALSAQESHSSIHINDEGRICAIQSGGNPWSHIVLRGACNTTNYDVFSVQDALARLKKSGLTEHVMIDCAHGNCQKDADRQRDVFYAVLEQMEKGNDRIFGMMLESHLESGNQPLMEDPSLLKYAVSITDPCLNWKETEELIYSADEAFSSVSVSG
jgi:3-deoxy-7-phosphoheptulonate synthase